MWRVDSTYTGGGAGREGSYTRGGVAQGREVRCGVRGARIDRYRSIDIEGRRPGRDARGGEQNVARRCDLDRGEGLL